ncbi:MAG: hypothetical protein JXA64_02495 [Candidatus Fermentibacteraceae bacterium]|nr:hypothetical protein [Candidatus Fermentibacteraceae bacterium]MBN2607957.1 hypothetical protein [Candidatus Fermentibacteraceae bacterium]
MKRLICVLLIAGTSSLTAGMLEYGLHGGLLLPSGDAGDFYSTSFLIGGQILVHMPSFAVEGSIGYGILKAEEDINDFSASLIPILAGIRSYSGPIFYGGGAGLYMASVSYSDAVYGNVDSSDEDFGAYGNLGMIFPAGTIDLEGSIKYHLVDFDTDKAWVSLTVGTYF